MITKEQLKEIGDKLPNGALKVISENAGYSYVYTSLFFSGKCEVNANNLIILKKANQYMRDFENDAKDSLK